MIKWQVTKLSLLWQITKNKAKSSLNFIFGIKKYSKKKKKTIKY